MRALPRVRNVDRKTSLHSLDNNGHGTGSTSNLCSIRERHLPTIDYPGFGGGAAAGWWTIAGLLGLLGMRRRAMSR